MTAYTINRKTGRVVKVKKAGGGRLTKGERTYFKSLGRKSTPKAKGLKKSKR